MTPSLCDDQALIELLHQKGARVALVGAGTPDKKCSAAMIDDFQAAFQMTSHVASLGHRRIGFIAGDPHRVAYRRRLEGYLHATEMAGLELADELVVYASSSYRSGLKAALRLFEQAEPPTAIFASTDELASAVIATALRLQIDVPGDLSVCGFGDSEIAASSWLGLSTVHLPFAEMARCAIEMLAKDLRAASSGELVEPRHETFNYRLIHRQSEAEPGLARNAF